MAESKNITIEQRIQIPPKLPIEPIDLCTVFGNALDNAIEACEHIEEGIRRISLTIICQDERLFCKIENTAFTPGNKLFKTAKADKNNHGFGIENIKTALAKYDSIPSFEYSNNTFTLKFVVFLKSE